MKQILKNLMLTITVLTGLTIVSCREINEDETNPPMQEEMHDDMDEDLHEDMHQEEPHPEGGHQEPEIH